MWKTCAKILIQHSRFKTSWPVIPKRSHYYLFPTKLEGYNIPSSTNFLCPYRVFLVPLSLSLPYLFKDSSATTVMYPAIINILLPQIVLCNCFPWPFFSLVWRNVLKDESLPGLIHEKMMVFSETGIENSPCLNYYLYLRSECSF